MLPSSTVENYLKAIYLGVGALAPGHRLLPMGQLASSLGVAPGTATTMVKTLAEAGLVEYEPYTGVTLTAAGERLAALVLRRHRLIELFLVQVMGFSWDEVHDDAEQLVQMAGALIAIICGASLGIAQPTTPPKPNDTSPPFEISDNSFLVEEAFNQEAGVFQNIFNLVVADGGEWEAGFTQE